MRKSKYERIKDAKNQATKAQKALRLEETNGWRDEWENAKRHQ